MINLVPRRMMISKMQQMIHVVKTTLTTLTEDLIQLIIVATNLKGCVVEHACSPKRPFLRDTSRDVLSRPYLKKLPSQLGGWSRTFGHRRLCKRDPWRLTYVIRET